MREPSNKMLGADAALETLLDGRRIFNSPQLSAPKKSATGFVFLKFYEGLFEVLNRISTPNPTKAKACLIGTESAYPSTTQTPFGG